MVFIPKELQTTKFHFSQVFVCEVECLVLLAFRHAKVDPIYRRWAAGMMQAKALFLMLRRTTLMIHPCRIAAGVFLV
jgi:hypothetical protein